MDESMNELYQDIILEHNKYPRNKGSLAAPARSARGDNPSCGDNILIFVVLENDILKKISFEGEGCAISQASASLMTELLTGKSRGEAIKIIDEICLLLTDINSDSGEVLHKYGEIAALAGVRKFPMRIKCATLAWHAAKEAISQQMK